MLGHNTDRIDSDEIDLSSMVKVLWRGKWVILIGILLGTALAMYFVLRVAEPKYEASAIVELQPEKTSPLDLDSLVSGISSDSTSLKTEVENLLSRELAEQVVDAMNLVEDPFYNEALDPSELSEIKKLAKDTLGLGRNVPPPTEEEFTELERRRTVNALRETVTVQNQNDTYLLTISVVSNRPKKAANIANSFAQFYLAKRLQTNSDEASQSIEWLSERVRELEVDIHDREQVINEFQSQSALINQDTLGALELQVKQFRDQYEERTEDLVRLTESKDLLEAARASGSLSSILEANPDRILLRLGQSLSEDLSGSSEARAAFDAQLDRLEIQLDRQISQASARLPSLNSSIERLQSQLSEQKADLQRLEQMQRELQVASDLYRTFLTGLQEATVQVGLVRSGARIMSSALPPLRSFSPRPVLSLAVMMLLGATLAASYVLIADALQPGLRTSEEIEKVTGQTVLGMIPIAPIKARGKLVDFIQQNPTSPVVEAVRNVRTSILMLSPGTEAGQVIMLTSSVPGEGKTSMSFILAQNFCGMGKRVVIIESDIRRNVFREYFEKGSAGDLISVMEGKVPFDEAVQFQETLGCHLLWGGASTDNPADVFSRTEFADVIEQARKAFDIVIIDTAPVLAVTDARIIARVTDVNLLLVKWKSTTVEDVLKSQQQLSIAGHSLTGVVMTQVNTAEMRRYGGYGYGDYSSKK